MSTLVIASVLFAVLIALLLCGVWIAIALGVVAFVGFAFFTSTPPDVNLFQSFWGTVASWNLAALPLFSQTSADNTRLKKALERFPEADADKDGVLSMAEAKARGKVRIEGKEYVMQDGDVVEFRFNV